MTLRDYTDDPQTRFNQLPGNPEIWHEKETGRVYAVYFVPGSDPPIPMLYHVPDEATLQIFYGDVPLYSDQFAYDRNLTRGEIGSTGAVPFGTTNDIPETTGEPWAGFLSRMERAKETQPWLEDPEVFTVVAGAWLEGRDPEQWEFEGTDWWQSRTEAERDWAYLSLRDPEEANRLVETNTINVFNRFRDEGVDSVSEELTQFIATRISQGLWSDAYASDQIDGLLFGDNATGLDPELNQFLSDREIEIQDPTTNVTQVQSAWREWLGPAYPPSEADIDKWTKRLRQNPEAGGDELIQHLQKQRMALFPTYDDPTLTYEDIASPWRSFVSNAWGQTIDETDPFFTNIVQLNDAHKAGQEVRREGLFRGVGRVHQDALKGLLSQTGQIRRAV